MEVSVFSVIVMVTMSPLAYYDSLFVVGSRDEAMNIRGLRYHPVDIESTVVRCHKNIVERYAVSCILQDHHTLYTVLCSHGPNCLLSWLNWEQTNVQH